MRHVTMQALPTTVGQLGDLLAASDSLRVRSAWGRESEGTWRLLLLEIIDGVQPPVAEADEWAYQSVCFTAESPTGTEVGSWLRGGKVTRRDDGEQDIGQPAGRLSWERRESFAQSGYGPLEWPSYEVRIGQMQTNEPPRPLLSDSGAPSFASFYNAAACFFALSPSRPGGSLPSFAMYRWVDTRARINRVEVSNEELLVEVEGAALGDLTVELAGDVPGQAKTLCSSDDTIAVVTFPLLDGLPAGAWVVVRAGSEWLDRRFLTWPWASGDEIGVRVEVSARTKIDAFIASRENDTVEFKERIPETDVSKAKVMKTVCAFANGSGGSLLFGITDDYDVVGVPEARTSRYQDTLADLVDAWIEPTPPFSFQVLPVEGAGMAVVELIVSAGPALYALAKPNETHKVYVRHHSRSVPARVREIEAIAQARAANRRDRY